MSDLDVVVSSVKWTPLSRPILGEFKVDCVFSLDRHLLSEIEVSRYLVVESLMRPFLIIEEEVVGQPQEEPGYGVVGVEVEVFVFDGAPEAFDEHIVQGSAASVHADPDAFPLQSGGEAGGGELGAL